MFSSVKEHLRAFEKGLYRFIVGKRVVPPAYEVKRLTIEEYSRSSSANTLIETGTYLGETVDALKDTFLKLVSIELDDELFRKARAKFADYPHISILHGDSSRVLPGVLVSVHEPAVFWLDGHYSGTGTAKGESHSPILGELKAILNHPVKNHVILIDDGRCFVGENGYPTVKELFSYVHSLNSSLHLSLENDIIRILPCDTPGCSHSSSYTESWRQVAGRYYRRLRKPVKRLFCW